MPFANMLSITTNPFLSMVIWIALVLATLYFARRPFHRAVGSLAKIIHNAMRMTAAAVLSAEKKLARRNHEILMAAGREKAERLVEREFDRISTSVTRDLAGYPYLQHRLLELTTRLDDDYNASADVPPLLPNWQPIIESIACIKSGDSLVADVLGEINRTLAKQHTSAIENYRKSNASRYGLLKKMMPLWRRVQKTLEEVGGAIENLDKRGKRIERFMDEYEQIRLQTDKAARILSSSALMQFLVSGMLLLIAFGGSFINFNLIALPISEIIGNTSHIGLYKTADVAGLIIILFELVVGLFIMESLRITRLFPTIGGLDSKMRHRIIWVAVGLLTVLAGLQAALAFVSERMTDPYVLSRDLPGFEQVAGVTGMIPAAGKMIMAFFFPFILTFATIPLESFVSSARTVLGIILTGALRLTAFLLRLVGNIVYYLGRFVVNLYDLLIFPSIWLESVLTGSRTYPAQTGYEPFYEDGRAAENAVDRKK